VRGWVFSPDGKLLEGGTDGIVLAGDPAKDAIEGSACAGPKGTFLLVYAEPRGVDDTKVVAKIVK